MNNYIINENTLWFYNVDNNIVINEKNNTLELKNIKIFNFLNESCLFYGSSYNGRKMGTKALINEAYRLPIIINEYNNLIFFPINGCRNIHSLWLNFNKIAKYHQISKNKVYVEFTNGQNTTFLTSYYKFHHQILKCSRLLVIFTARKCQISF